MNNQLIPFSFEEKEVRVVVIDGTEWWVARDVATALGYKNTHDAIKKHCRGVAKRDPLETSGGVQKVRVINEGDVFRLIVHSPLPEGERFEKWLFEKVLPEIRRTGGYSAVVNGWAELQYLDEENERLKRVIRRYENRNFLTAGDRIDILTLYARKYPVSAIQRITKKGRARIKKFLDGALALSEEEMEAELKAWYKAEGREGGEA
jgi:prophage antirepressor-like protein